VTVILQLRLDAKRHCLYLRGWFWLASEEFLRCHHTKGRAAAWGCSTANGVVVSGNFIITCGTGSLKNITICEPTITKLRRFHRSSSSRAPLPSTPPWLGSTIVNPPSYSDSSRIGLQFFHHCHHCCSFLNYSIGVLLHTWITAAWFTIRLREKPK